MGLNNHTWAFTPKSSMSEVMVNRFAILCGPLAQLCFVIFLPAGLLLPPISPSLSPEQTAEHYRKNLTGMEWRAGILARRGRLRLTGWSIGTLHAECGWETGLGT